MPQIHVHQALYCIFPQRDLHCFRECVETRTAVFMHTKIYIDFNSTCLMCAIPKLHAVSKQKAAFLTPTLPFYNEKVCKLEPFVLQVYVRL